MTNAPLSALEQRDDFVARHIGPNADEIATMLAAIGVPNLDTLIDETVPQALPPDSYAVLLAEYGVQAHVAGRLRVELTLLHSDESFENVYEAEIV